MSVRKDLEKEIYEFLDDLDPSGKNTERMRNFFMKMSDPEFYRYMTKFFNDDAMNFSVAYEPLDNPVTVDFAVKIGKKHGIPMNEIIYKPYLTKDLDDPPAGIHPMLVIDVPIKRLKQMVISKNHTSITNTKRDSRTGQVTGHDKTARVTDAEVYSLIVQELYQTAEEEFGPLSDDSAAMYEMLRLIQRDGEVSLKDLPKDPTNRTTMNTVEMYMLGACLCTNMLEESGYVLPITMYSKDDRSSAIKKG